MLTSTKKIILWTKSVIDSIFYTELLWTLFFSFDFIEWNASRKIEEMLGEVHPQSASPARVTQGANTWLLGWTNAMAEINSIVTIYI
jgi:hypothetical protein